MYMRIIFLVCLCVVTTVHAAAVNEACATNTDCTETDNVCQDLFCKVKQGGACTGTDVSKCVKYTTCTSNVCTCINPGSKVDGDVCTQVYDATCTVAAVASDCQANLPNSECSGDPLKCKCVAGYKSSGTPPTCMKVLGGGCTADVDCTDANSTCSGADNAKTCKCKSGYKENANICIKKVIGDICTEDSDDCMDAVDHSECKDSAGSKKCTCMNGYNGAASATECTVVYNTLTCGTNNGICTAVLKYGKCSATKCMCDDTAVVEDSICKRKIDGDCATGDLCPNNAGCTASTCSCNDNYEKENDKCKATNSGMAVMASLMLIVTALASVLLR